MTTRAKPKPMRRVKTPMECRSGDDLARIPRDNINTPTHWILCDGDQVTIAEQRQGHKATAMVSIPRAIFNRFLRWYATGDQRGKIITPPPKPKRSVQERKS